jgi:hypothetical protein
VRLPGHSIAQLTEGLPPEIQAYVSRHGRYRLNKLLAFNATNVLAATPEQAGIMLNISVATLMTWRKRGIGPKFARVHKQIRYPVDELKRWLMEQIADPVFDLAARKDHPQYRQRADKMAYANSRRKRKTAA